MPKQEEMDAAPVPAPATEEEAAPSLLKGMANRSFWMIGIAFGCYNLVAMAMVTFLPVFLEVVRGYSLTYDNGLLMHASFVTAFIFGASIFTGPGGGYISDRLGKRKIMVLIPYILMTITFLFPFTVTGSLIPLYAIVFGIVGGPLAAVLLASVPEVAKKPQYIGIGMSVAIFGQNIGMYISGALFPRIQVAAGWEAAGYWMIPICLIGIIATLFIKVR
jgi:predicted MFS family arabinose efflux permease